MSYLSNQSIYLSISLSVCLSTFVDRIFNKIFFKQKSLKNDPNKIKHLPLQQFVEQEQRANSPESSDKVSRMHLKKNLYL